MRYMLNYVNLPQDTVYLDRVWSNYDELEAWVKDNYPNFTSYQVVVTRHA